MYSRITLSFFNYYAITNLLLDADESSHNSSMTINPVFPLSLYHLLSFEYFVTKASNHESYYFISSSFLLLSFSSNLLKLSCYLLSRFLNPALELRSQNRHCLCLNGSVFFLNWFNQFFSDRFYLFDLITYFLL